MISELIAGVRQLGKGAQFPQRGDLTGATVHFQLITSSFRPSTTPG